MCILSLDSRAASTNQLAPQRTEFEQQVHSLPVKNVINTLGAGITVGTSHSQSSDMHRESIGDLPLAIRNDMADTFGLVELLTEPGKGKWFPESDSTLCDVDDY